MRMESLKKLYVHELKDLYSAENQITEALPRMIAAADDEGLRDALNGHLDETRGQITRLEKIFKGMEFSPRGHRCKGMEGLITEGEDLVSEIEDDDVLDAAIIAACQRIEHYEIAGYGVARAFAEKLGEYEAADLLKKSLEEEGMADRTLTDLAERRINFEATV